MPKSDATARDLLQVTMLLMRRLGARMRQGERAAHRACADRHPDAPQREAVHPHRACGASSRSAADHVEVGRPARTTRLGVSRTIPAENRRQTIVALTAEGKRVLEKDGAARGASSVGVAELAHRGGAAAHPRGAGDPQFVSSPPASRRRKKERRYERPQSGSGRHPRPQRRGAGAQPPLVARGRGHRHSRANRRSLRAASAPHDGAAFVTDSVRQGALLVTVTATGTLQPINQVDVGSEVSGIIDRVLVDFNATVKRARCSQSSTRSSSTRASRPRTRRSRCAVRRSCRLRPRWSRRRRSCALARSRREEHRLAAVARDGRRGRPARGRRGREREGSGHVGAGGSQGRADRPVEGRDPLADRRHGIAREIDPGQTVAATFQTPVLFKVAKTCAAWSYISTSTSPTSARYTRPARRSFRVDAYPGKSFEAEITSVRFNPRTVNNVVTYETVLSVANPTCCCARA